MTLPVEGWRGVSRRIRAEQSDMFTRFILRYFVISNNRLYLRGITVCVCVCVSDYVHLCVSLMLQYVMVRLHAQQQQHQISK